MMTKKRSAKHTFIVSIVSMVLCLTMVIGTSLAWFTDTATNYDNEIYMGELGIQLSMYIGQNDEEQEVWEDISDKNAGYIFNKDKNGYWEPGTAEVVFLKVTNIKQLALEYNAALDVAVENMLGGTVADVSQVMEYAVIPGMYRLLYESKANELANAQTPVTGWEAVKAIALEAEAEYNKDLPDEQKLSFINKLTKGSSLVLPEGELKRDESAYFALAVHMLPAAGNEFQKHKVVVDVRANAKQMTEEEDYFGSNYDIDARYHEPWDGGLFVNGGAEEVEFGWGKSSIVTTAYDNFKDGNKSFKFTKPANATEDNIYSMYQKFLIDPNKKYRMTAYVYVVGEEGGTTNLKNLLVCGQKNRSRTVANNEWVGVASMTVKGKDITGSSDVKEAAFEIRLYGNAACEAIYVDNICLEVTN